jgi:dTDP-4-amino-4,6-dideoxygalactose transaminase
MEVMPHGFSITLKPELNGKISELTDIMDKYNIHWKRNFGFCGSHTALKEFVDKDYPWATWCGDNGIHVGTHRFMSQDDIDRINTAIGEFFNE